MLVEVDELVVVDELLDVDEGFFITSNCLLTSVLVCFESFAVTLKVYVPTTRVPNLILASRLLMLYDFAAGFADALRRVLPSPLMTDTATLLRL